MPFFKEWSLNDRGKRERVCRKLRHTLSRFDSTQSPQAGFTIMNMVNGENVFLGESFLLEDLHFFRLALFLSGLAPFRLGGVAGFAR